MKNLVKTICLLSLLAFFSSCEKDEGKLPNINFVIGAGYTSSDVTVAKGGAFKIGITASKAEDKDVLKSFDISRSINGAAGVSVFNKSLSTSEEDNFAYDYNATADTISGQTNKYTFTITNRDGITNQVSLTVTVQ